MTALAANLLPFSLHLIIISMREEIAQARVERPRLRLNKPAIQLSAVTDWHCSGIPHYSSSMKGRGEILDFIFIREGVNHLTAHTRPD